MATAVWSVARQPRVAVGESDSVFETVRRMVASGVGAAVVLSGDRLAGIFTERDLMKRVVAQELPPRSTPVSAVMTRDVKTLDPRTPMEDALRLMLEYQFRHAPLLDESGQVVGMLSLRDLLRYQVERLNRELDSVIERFTNDAPGG